MQVINLMIVGATLVLSSYVAGMLTSQAILEFSSLLPALGMGGVTSTTMPHSKKQKLSRTNLAPTAGIEGDRSNDISSAANDEMTFNNLGTDEIANIFGYLTPKDITYACSSE